MRLLIGLYFSFIISFAFSQTRFNTNIPVGTDTLIDIGIKVIELKNKQYLSCGISQHPDINYKSGYLVKMDSLGNLIWKKQYDVGIDYDDFFQDLVELPDSNYLICGITGNPTLDLDEAFLAKIDTGGNIVWLKKYPYANSNEQPRSMKLTPDGKVIIVGNSFTTGYSNVLLIKTDLDGNLIWRKSFGNAYDEVYENIDIIKKNTEYILGGRYGYYSSGNPYYDFSIMRTDTAGNEIWQQQYGAAIDETAKGGTATLDSGYVLCGTYNGEGAIIKIDKQGNWQWFKNYSLAANSIITQVKQLMDSSYVMITSDVDWQNVNRTGFLIKGDKNGNMLWKRIYPHPPTSPSISNYFFGFNTTADKGFIITGQYNHIGQPYQNMWLVKTDSLGCDSVGGCSYLPTNIVSSSEVENIFNVYPNPANSVIKINLSSHPVPIATGIVSGSHEMRASTKLSVAEYFIKITDVLGKEFSCPLPIAIGMEGAGGGFLLDVSSLQQGIYFLSVYKGKELLGTKKIIKE